MLQREELQIISNEVLIQRIRVSGQDVELKGSKNTTKAVDKQAPTR